MIKKEEFEQIKIVEVLDHYDGPIVFTFVNKQNDFYLAYYCETEKDLITKKWLYILTNQYSVDELKNDKISIHAFIKRAKIVTLATTVKNKVESVETKSFDQIPAGYVPEDEIFLESDNKDFVVKLNKKNVTPANVNGEIVALVVSRVSEGIRGVMKDVQNSYTEFKDNLIDPGLALTAIKAGSVELVFKPMHRNELLAKSLDVLNDVVSDKTTDLKADLVTAVKRHVINMAPTNRRGFNFDSMNFLYPNIDSKISSFELTNELRKEFKSSLPVETDREVVVVLSGLIKEYDKRDSSFMLCDIDVNTNKITGNIKCVLMTANYLEDQVEEVSLELFNNDKKAKVVGKYSVKENKIFVQSVSEA